MKNMKKLLWALAMLVLVLVLTPARPAQAINKEEYEFICPLCKTPSTDIRYYNLYYHIWVCVNQDCENWIETYGGFRMDTHFGGIATCTQKAVCDLCNHEYGDYAHEWEMANWTMDDVKHWHVCGKGCGAKKDEALHNYDNWTYVDDDTCKGTCVCGSEIIEIHSWGPWKPDENGTTHSSTCERCCDATKTEAHQASRYEFSDTSHTCICTICKKNGYEYKTESHTFENWHDNGDGTHTGKCICGREKTEDHSGVVATCTEKAKCEVCGQYGEPLGHELKEIEMVEPTCTEPGTEAYWTCQRKDCGKMFSDDKGETEITKPETIKALGHDLIHHEAKAATCAAVGWDAYDSCSRCDYTTYVEKAALGHDLVHHDAKAPTCTEAGWDAYDTCSRCDYTTYAEKPAKGHTEVKDEAVPATTEKTGLTEGSHCSVCGEVIKAQEIIPKLPEPAGEDEPPHVHTPVTDARVEPTCTKAGLMEGKHCSECGEVLEAQEEIPMTGHWFDNWVPDDEGSHRANCRRCRFTGSVPCVMFVLPREEGAEEISFCPVCGYCAGAEDMTASEDMALIGGAPKSANLKVFLLETGEDKYLVLAFEHHGELVQPEGKVSFAPMEALAETAFAQVGTDGTETPAEMTVNEYGLTLTLDFIPEGEDPVPVMILKIS